MQAASAPTTRTFTELARRKQIVQAAIETIAEHGYPRASFARIAELMVLRIPKSEDGEGLRDTIKATPVNSVAMSGKMLAVRKNNRCVGIEVPGWGSADSRRCAPYTGVMNLEET